MEFVKSKKYEYRHKWKIGDFVIWDNRILMHKANGDYDMNERRYLYRIMLKVINLIKLFTLKDLCLVFFSKFKHICFLIFVNNSNKIDEISKLKCCYYTESK